MPSGARGTGTTGGASGSPRTAASRRARAAGVGASNSALKGTSTPKAARTRDASRVASSEWPPRSKKSDCGLTPSTPSTSAHSPASSSSAAERGGAAASPPAVSGAGRARRSSLPVAVKGRASRRTN